MTPISKILSLLLTVLVVTSLFVPAVAANEGTSNPTITPEEAMEIRLDTGHLSALTHAGVGYRYNRTDYILKNENDGIYWRTHSWDIYTGNQTDFFTIVADNDEKRAELLKFMATVDEKCGKEAKHDCGWGMIASGSLIHTTGMMMIACCVSTGGLLLAYVGIAVATAGIVMLVKGADDTKITTQRLQSLI